MRVALKTIGCKLNQYETQLIGEQFARRGYEWVNFGEKAEVYVINTCTVTAKADYSSRQAISRACRLAQKDPALSNGSALIVVTGCYAEVDPQRLLDLPGVDLVVGNQHKSRLVELVQQFSSGGGRSPLLIQSPPIRAPILEEPPPISGMRGYSRAFIEIQDGCECSCSYCIIPKARGAEVSRPSRLVVEQARNLARSGYREMVLTGIHIGRYRDGEMGLTGLLERLLHDKMGMRLRLSSIEPEEVTQGLIDLLAAQTGLCPHLHIAIQSADDGIIRAMNRGYTQGLLSELLAGIASRVPGVTLGADLMVGFPGETERSFLNTMSFVEASPLAYLHVFSYSDRPGTAASSFKRKVSPEEKSRRSRLLVALGRSKKRKHLKGFLGRELGVLVESRRHRKSGLLTGLSDNYLRLVFEGPDELKGRIVKVKALHLLEGELRGELV